jgi:hypothetical protein
MSRLQWSIIYVHKYLKERLLLPDRRPAHPSPWRLTIKRRKGQTTVLPGNISLLYTKEWTICALKAACLHSVCTWRQRMPTSVMHCYDRTEQREWQRRTNQRANESGTCAEKVTVNINKVGLMTRSKWQRDSEQLHLLPEQHYELCTQKQSRATGFS